MSVPLPPKKEVALALLERSSVHVHLDPRFEGVVVPAWFKKQPQLVLQIGLNMPVPIPDLRLDEAGMSCTLSFNRTPFFCVVPWGSVYAMVGEDGRGMVWPDDVPPEVASQARGREGDGAAGAAAKRPAASPRPLRGEARAEARTPDAEGAKAKKPRKRVRSDSTSAGAGETESGGYLAGPPAPSPARANLVSVPSPEKKPGPAAQKSRPSPQPSSQQGVPAAQPAPAEAKPAAPRLVPAERRPSPARPKRELPPYLRVVK
jgi:stringent starvation protein B